MKHLKSYKLFESVSEIIEFIDYLKHDLEDDGFNIRQSDSSFEFMKDKWKNIRRNDSSWESRRKEFEFYKGKEVEVFEILTNRNIKTPMRILNPSVFNVYDVIPHVRRLLDYAKSLGYNHFEIRKICQMSRRSQDVTNQFISGRKLGDSAKRDIRILQILIMK
jgi:hypothetical protein